MKIYTGYYGNMKAYRGMTCIAISLGVPKWLSPPLPNRPESSQCPQCKQGCKHRLAATHWLAEEPTCRLLFQIAKPLPANFSFSSTQVGHIATAKPHPPSNPRQSPQCIPMPHLPPANNRSALPPKGAHTNCRSPATALRRHPPRRRALPCNRAVRRTVPFAFSILPTFRSAKNSTMSLFVAYFLPFFCAKINAGHQNRREKGTF